MALPAFRFELCCIKALLQVDTLSSLTLRLLHSATIAAIQKYA